MNQIANIFRKDVRHHWKEIALSLAILVAFAWFEIRSWSDYGPAATGLAAAFFDIRFLGGLVNVLVPASWIFLIVRAIQGESPVGDRQFWVTRPYDWKQLIAAKILFVLIFINLPLLILDIFLLAHAGFHPTAYISGLLWMQWNWLLTVFLAIVTLATVTATISQMLLGLLLIVLYMVGMSFIAQMIPNAVASGGSDTWMGVLFVAASIAVILLQYARRKTRVARWLIVGFCGLLTLIRVITPYRSVIAGEYPLSHSQTTPQFSLLASTHTEGYPGEAVSISFPLSVSGIPQDSFVQLNGMIVTLTNSSGFHWESGWHFQAQALFPDYKKTTVTFELKQKVYDQLKSTPVTVRLLLAFTSYQDKNQRPFVIPGEDFTLPDLGRCSSQYFGALRCLVPLRRPRFLLISSEATASTCPLRNGEKPANPGQMARDSIQGGSEPAEMGISPIHEVRIYLTGRGGAEDGFIRGLCPGTPVILSNPEPVGRSHIELQFDNLKLDDYRVGSGALGSIIVRHR